MHERGRGKADDEECDPVHDEIGAPGKEVVSVVHGGVVNGDHDRAELVVSEEIDKRDGDGIVGIEPRVDSWRAFAEEVKIELPRLFDGSRACGSAEAFGFEDEFERAELHAVGIEDGVPAALPFGEVRVDDAVEILIEEAAFPVVLDGVREVRSEVPSQRHGQQRGNDEGRGGAGRPASRVATGGVVVDAAQRSTNRIHKMSDASEHVFNFRIRENG